MTDLPKNRCRGSGPDEGFGMPVVVRDVILDGANQIRDAAKRAAANALARDLGKPTFDQIQPRRAGRNEMTLLAGMGGEPPFNGRMGVGAVVVEDEMHLSPPRDRAIEPGQEGEELAVTFARMTLRQHGAVQNVQCR